MTEDEKLQQHREWLQVTLASIGDAVITTDLRGTVTFLNPVAEALTGWQHEEAVGRPLTSVFRIVNEETRRPADNPVEQVLQLGQIVGLANHTALIRRDGVELGIEDSAAPIRDRDGKVTGAVLVFHDVSRRREVERALRASEERLRAVFSQAAMGIAVVGLDGYVQEANRKFQETLGYSSQELQQRTIFDLTHPDDRGVTQAQVRRLLEGSIDSYALEKRYLRKNGSYLWVNVTVTLLRRESGSASQMIGVVEDITDRKQADEIRSRYAALIESSDDAIITKTLEGVITTWNPGAERIYGYSPQEAIGQPITMLIPEEHPDEEPTILARLRRGERIEHYETVRKRKDGALVDISLSVSPLKDSEGRVIGAAKIARDITRQKRTEKALREQSRVFELLYSTGRSIASQLNVETILQTVTETATQLTGAKFGAFFYNVVNEKGEAFLLYTLSGASREAFEKLGLPRNTPVFQPTFRGEGVVRSADITRDPRYGLMEPHRGMPKAHLPIRSYLAVPVVSRSDEVIGGLFFGHPEVNVFDEGSERLALGVAAQAAIAIDNARLYEARREEIAKREHAEAALRETDRRKDEFLATLAHELRNPLAPIRQAAMISNASAATEAQKRWSHGVISRQVQHMSLLLDDLLDISRITRGTLELRTEMTELAAIVDAAVETARPSIDAKGHTFAAELPSQPIRFVCDPLRMAQVLSNILTNAAKYTDPGGNVRLRAWADKDTVTIVVTDTGVGIPAEALSRVFSMFSQVKEKRDRSEGGLGIGLALARGLVELHGGSIEVHSDGEDRGSEFTVRLPRRTIPVDGELPLMQPADHRTVKRRILIADDNRDAAESLAVLLRLEGHDVTVVYDGPEALTTFNALLPEVALLDIGMPGLNGYEVARRVRQGSLGRAVTLIAVTGWGQETDKAQALAAGFNHHFTKPIRPDRLIDLLRSS